MPYELNKNRNAVRVPKQTNENNARTTRTTRATRTRTVNNNNSTNRNAESNSGNQWTIEPKPESLNVPEELQASLPVISLEELAQYRGPTQIRVGLCGIVFDVSPSSALYGPGGPYHVFAGRDITRALAYGWLDEEKVIERPGDCSDMSGTQFMTLESWIEEFSEKYVPVALIPVPRHPSPDSSSSSDSSSSLSPSVDRTNNKSAL